MKKSARINCGACGHTTLFNHLVSDALLNNAPHYCDKCSRRLLNLNGAFAKRPTKKPKPDSPSKVEAEMYTELKRSFQDRKTFLIDSGISVVAKENYNPKISIAMTVYNAVKFLDTSISSVMTQDYTNWELCILNDYSTDDSLGEITKQINRHKIENKVKIISHKANCGYGRSLKDAIEMGNGELVAVIDSDDALSRKDALSIMVEAHRLYPDSALVYSTYWACHDIIKKELIKLIVPIPANKNILDYMITGTLKKYRASHLKVFKRDCYNDTNGIDPTLRKTVDKDLVLRLEETRFKNNNYHGSLVFINIPLYFHRKHPNSLTESYGQQGKDYIRMVQRDKARIIRNAKNRRGIPFNEKDISREKKYNNEKA